MEVNGANTERLCGSTVRQSIFYSKFKVSVRLFVIIGQAKEEVHVHLK
jgi:hypothetical protein